MLFKIHLSEDVGFRQIGETVWIDCREDRGQVFFHSPKQAEDVAQDIAAEIPTEGRFDFLTILLESWGIESALENLQPYFPEAKKS